MVDINPWVGPLLSVHGAKMMTKKRSRIRYGLPCGQMERASTDAANAKNTSKSVLTAPPNAMTINFTDRL